MHIAYTICSANYLPFAKALADSVVKQNPGYRFVIALADSDHRLDKGFFAPHDVVPVGAMGILYLPELSERYTVFELSCALKPSVARYLLAGYPDCNALFYFDSDILVFGSLSLAEEALRSHGLVLTPHLYTALPYDQSAATERGVLRSGIYNAGFFGISRSPETQSFLLWWEERLRYHCFHNQPEGWFVDQLWLNLAPVYTRTLVLKDPGYNLAYWNFPERRLTQEGGVYRVNGRPLVFFHYSGYDLRAPAVLCRYQSQPDFDSHPEMRPLFDDYRARVEASRLSAFADLPPALGKQPPAPGPRPKKSMRQKWKKLFGSGRADT